MIIGISGWKGSGKDVMAEYLVKEYGFVQYSFAKILKDMVSEQYDINREWLDCREMKETPLLQYPAVAKDAFTKVIIELLQNEFKSINNIPYWTPRALAILEGSIKRAVNSEYWTEKVIEKIKKDNNKAVISDMRYISEIKTFKNTFSNDFYSVRINRFTDCDSTDASERDLDNYNFDYTIMNTTNYLHRFKRDIDSFVNFIKRKS